MVRTFEEALGYAQELFCSKLEVAFQKEAQRAVYGRPTKFPSQRTGNLLDIRGKVEAGVIMFSFPFYAKYLEFGTGVFGKYRQRIRPKNKKALAFGKSLGGGKKEFVFGSVAGIRPAPFIRPVLHGKMVDLLVESLNEAFEDVLL